MSTISVHHDHALPAYAGSCYWLPGDGQISVTLHTTGYDVNGCVCGTVENFHIAILIIITCFCTICIVLIHNL